MFVWDKSIQKIDVAAGQVVQLFRSMRDVQMVLPGLPVQLASAYLCQYKTSSGIATLAVFHMQKSQHLAFYSSQPGVVDESKSEDVFASGLNFVESMGFLLSDMDLHLLSEQDRFMLWESLPVTQGAEPQTTAPAVAPEPQALPANVVQAPRPVATPAVPQVAVEPDGASGSPDRPDQISGQREIAPSPAVTRQQQTIPAEQTATRDESSEVDESVNDLLAAVEALRAKRPGLQARRKSLKPAEMQKRRIGLRQNVGRLLVSL